MLRNALGLNPQNCFPPRKHVGELLPAHPCLGAQQGWASSGACGEGLSAVHGADFTGNQRCGCSPPPPPPTTLHSTITLIPY